MSKCIKIIFTISLLLNLALIGVVGGGVWKRWNHPMPFQEASDETRALFKQAFENNRDAMRADIDALRTARPALEKIITAQDFNRAAYDAEINTILKVRSGMEQRRAQVLGDILAQLPAAERQKIAPKMLEKLTDDQPREYRGRHGKKHADRKTEPNGPSAD